MKEVNTREVARLAEVSQATVSRVMNNNLCVSAATRKRVIEAARSLGYDSCSRDSQGNVGVIMLRPKNLANVFFADLLSALSYEIARRNYRMELIWQGEMARLDDRVIRGAFDLTDRMEIPEEWSGKFNLPLVRIGAPSLPEKHIYAVNFDGVAACRAAVRLLQSYGHRNIYFVSLEGKEAEAAKASRRWPGFLQALAESNVADPERFGVFLRYGCTRGEITEALRKIIRAGGTAIICPTELFAIRIDPSLRDLGIRIPEDLSVIDWEFHNVSEFLEPPRTTIAVNFERMASSSLDLLEEMFAGKGAAANDVLVPPLLLSRQSVGPCKANERANEPSLDLTVQQRKILKLLSAGPLAAPEIAELLNIGKDNGNFRKNLQHLREEGLIDFSHPENPKDKRQQLYLVPQP